MDKLTAPLPLLDLITTVNLQAYWRVELLGIVQQFNAIKGRGLRIRIEVVDTRDLEACQANDE